MGRLSLGTWGSGQSSDGLVYEVIAFKRSLTDFEAEQVNNYLRKRYLGSSVELVSQTSTDFSGGNSRSFGFSGLAADKDYSLGGFVDRNGNGTVDPYEPQTLQNPLIKSGSTSPVSLRLVTPEILDMNKSNFSMDFESEPGTSWSIRSRMERPGSKGGQMLGPLSNGTIQWVLTNLPPHKTLQIALDLVVLKTMDGDEPLGVRVNGKEVFRSSFANNQGQTQFYPKTWAMPRVPNQTGAVESTTGDYAIYSLGFVVPDEGSKSQVALNAPAR
jgi:hypothetical protein